MVTYNKKVSLNADMCPFFIRMKRAIFLDLLYDIENHLNI